MNCPYCSEEMKRGELISDGRAPIRFIVNGESKSFLDVNKDHINKTIVAKKQIFGNTHIEAFKCLKCGKIIIDTNGEQS